MRVVFLGTPAFAVPSLQILIDQSHEICGVITQPDRPAGRGQKLQATPVKQLAQKHGIEVHQPARIRDEGNRGFFEKLQPDFIVVAAYGQILPGWLLRTARIAPLNVHASLLPRYRGAAPIVWAVLNGDPITGVTIMRMAEGLDSGDICLQKEIPISLNETAGELAAEIAEAGADLLVKALDGFKEGTIFPVSQDESKACWAPRITKEMAIISWESRAIDIHNRIRGLNPWPVACAIFRGENLKIWRSLTTSQHLESFERSGTLLSLTRQGICIGCGEGTVLEILEVQMPGKGKISGREFANGARLNIGDLVFDNA